MLFDIEEKTIVDIIKLDTYKGIYSFHKYWGKKPIESVNYFIQNYTSESDIVLDPFLGSRFISCESLKQYRRFIGIERDFIPQDEPVGFLFSINIKGEKP
jgi:DNA modification methylase